MTTNSRNTGILSPHVSCRSVVLAAVSTALIMLATLSIAPFGKLACPIFPPFVLMYAAMMSAMSGLTGYLVAVQFRARREPLLGALSGAFGYVSVLAFSQILVFPAALSPSMSSSGGPQSAIWMWVLWHAGFPVFVLIGGLLQKADLPGRTGGLPKRLGCALIPGGPAIGIFFAYYCIIQGRNLPALISGMSYVALQDSIYIPIIVVATMLALFTCAWTTKFRDLLSLWLAIALLASLFDTILTLSGGVRYDLGWYAGRMLSIISISTIFCVLIYEISNLYEDLAEAHRELAERVMRDGLTGAFNRRYFSEQFPRELSRAKRESSNLSLLMIDVDHFKNYNDLYGHQQGDQCLIEVASAIQDQMRRPGDFVARYGGEEFAILLPKTDVFGARVISETIRSAVAARKLMSEDGLAHAITVSVGLETFNPAVDSFSPEELLKHADHALYHAKHQGRNIVRAYEPNLKSQFIRA